MMQVLLGVICRKGQELGFGNSFTNLTLVAQRYVKRHRILNIFHQSCGTSCTFMQLMPFFDLIPRLMDLVRKPQLCLYKAIIKVLFTLCIRKNRWIFKNIFFFIEKNFHFRHDINRLKCYNF
jgi:hypothetical protein